MKDYKQRALELLNELSLDEKIAQVNCYWFPADKGIKELAEKVKNGIGVVSCLECRGHDLEYAVNIINKIQKKVIESSPHNIPAIFHMEGLCGLLINGAATFPSGIMRGASFDYELEEQIGKCVGDQAASVGISHVFAPVLDVTRDARFGRMYESYGEDETLVAKMGVAYTQGLQDDSREIKVEGVAKHFLGFHKGMGGLHGCDCVISESELREVYAKPFEAAISLAGLRGVMPCYNIINGELASASEYLLTDFLRNELGFDGLAVSDYCAIMNMCENNKIAQNKYEAGFKALLAGMDVEQQFPYGFGEELKAKFMSGEADIALLDRAVLHVLEAKFRMGLFEKPYADDFEEVSRKFYKGEDLCLKSALEGGVLLKNDGVLPLKKSYKKIAVIGYHGTTVRGMFGGYTNLSMYEGLVGDQTTMAGLEVGTNTVQEKYPGTNVRKENAFFEKFEDFAREIEPNSLTICQELERAFPDSKIVYAKGYDFIGNDESGFAEALKVIEDSDIAILTLGGKCGTGALCSMGENINSANINLPQAQEEFIKKAAKLNKPLVGVHFDGRPISSDAADKYLNAILEMWNPARYGAKATVKILKGEYNPSGKLPVCVAHSSGQLPLYYSHFIGSSYNTNEFYKDVAYIDSPLTPRYPFGFGLSYTQFKYSDLKISKTNLSAGDSFILSVKVENAGNADGDEIVQLYCKDDYASVARPNKSLLGFQRVSLKKGESKIIEFKVNTNIFAFYDNYKKAWRIEKGDISLFVGASSADIKLSDSVYIACDSTVNKHDKAFFALANTKNN